MEWTCLLVDLTGSDLALTWQDLTQGQDYGVTLSFVGSLEEAQSMLNGGGVLVQVLFANEHSNDVQKLLKAFQANVGCISEFQVIVCSEPSPAFMAGTFEFGIEQFVALSSWPAEVAAVTRNAVALVSDPTSAEARTVKLTQSIRSADQARIRDAAKELGELAEYDYRVAYAKGKACEATGDFGGAVDAFASSRGMNKMFRPSASGMGESLLVTGRVDEALAVFKQLEKTNPYDVERKANIAAAYVEKGDFESAQKYVDAAAKLSPEHSRVLEARAQVLLCTGKVNEAFKLMDNMSEVGPFFAAKLNELGIQLSQAGKGKSALALYQKAHRIVRPELRYKISLNAALACRRLAAWDMALKYLSRCQREYGASFAKLEKIRESIVAAKAQLPAETAKPAGGGEGGGSGASGVNEAS
jgi:tetratricopeptide (TPR) repeat protein